MALNEFRQYEVAANYLLYVLIFGSVVSILTCASTSLQIGFNKKLNFFSLKFYTVITAYKRKLDADGDTDGHNKRVARISTYAENESYDIGY